MHRLDKSFIFTLFTTTLILILASCQETNAVSNEICTTRKLNSFNDDIFLSSSKWEVCDGLEVKTKNKTIHHALSIETPLGTTDKSTVSFFEKILVNDSIVATFKQDIYIDTVTVCYLMNSMESFRINDEFGFLFYCSAEVYPYSLEDSYTLLQWSYFNGIVSIILGKIPRENELWNTIYTVNMARLSGKITLDSILIGNWNSKIELLKDT